MKIKKMALFIGLFVVMAGVLSSCTKSFCSVKDQAQTFYSFEKHEGADFEFKDGAKTKEIIEQATEKGMLTPSTEFNNFIEEKIDLYVEDLKEYYKSNGEDVSNFYVLAKDGGPFHNVEYARAIALFAGGENNDENTLWYNFDNWVKEAKTDPSVGIALCPDGNFIDLYKQTFTTAGGGRNTCISLVDKIYDGVAIEGKSWGYAWNLGPIEGLLVYPVSWLIYSLTTAFAGLGGFGIILAIFVVTLIVRGVLIALTFKPTLSQQKMTLLQPELTKIQNKYPNAATNPYDKQRMGQEQMALYKKHKINPFSLMIVMIFQFPIFIAVWGAMQGSSVLMSGDFLGLSLAAQTGNSIISFEGPWYVALIIFLLMAAGQVASMKIPQYIQKKKAEKQQKLVKNPTADQTQKTMSMVNNIMLIMIIVMGWSLPVSMCIYWFITSLIALGQSFLMQKIISNTAKKMKKK